MSTTIKILPPLLANQIAAGEDKRVGCCPRTCPDVLDTPDLHEGGIARDDTPIRVGDIADELRRVAFRHGGGVLRDECTRRLDIPVRPSVGEVLVL